MHDDPQRRMPSASGMRERPCGVNAASGEGPRRHCIGSPRLTQAEPARYTGPAMSDQQTRIRRRQGRGRTPTDSVADPEVAGGSAGLGVPPDADARVQTVDSESAAVAPAASRPADTPGAAPEASSASPAEAEAIRRPRDSADGHDIPWHLRPWDDEDPPASGPGSAQGAGNAYGGEGGGAGGGHPTWPPEVQPHHHAWVYAVAALFLLSLAFGTWGLWTVFRPVESLGGDLRAQNERYKQEISTLRRSDQISREANRDLQRTLAERDEEIAGLRADVAFYERFVGATGQRRGLSVHELKLQPERDDAWRFVATLTQNLNRGAINSGRLTVSVEGTREGRLQRLAWSQLRQQTAEPGLAYSFKYFQQVEGNLILPPGFEPLRMTVRLVPEGGSAVEQSFPWADVAAAPRAPGGGSR